MKAAVKGSKDLNELIRAIDGFKLKDLKTSDVQLVSRRINKLPLNDVNKIAYLGNFTLEPLNDYVKVFSLNERVLFTDYIGAYNQYFVEIMDEHGSLMEFNPDVIFLALSLKKLSPEIYYSFGSLSVESRRDKLNEIISTILDWAEQAKEKSNASVLLCNFSRPDYSHAGISDLKQEYSEAEFYFELNMKLIDLFRNDHRVYVFDMDKLSARFGRRKVTDAKMYYLAKMEWSERFLPVIATEIVRFIKALRNQTKKCLVLDLDNTLWGGVLGEDGPMGVRVGRDDPESAAYFDFQRKVLSLKERGVLLAICSKNNFEDVSELFEKRNDMPLKMDDFAAMEINWENKNENLLKIAGKLNLGTDSLVFIDDNPAECRLIETMLPEVKTVCLSEDPAAYSAIIDSLLDFEKAVITIEDREKSVQYQQNAQRQEHMQKIGDMRSYLQSLKTEIVIRNACIEDLTRVHQLFTKTNQFNVTTRRYTHGQVEEFYRNKSYDLSVVEARDQFGVIGTIGLYLLETGSDNSFRLDSFILSCRAMGRGIESAVMNYIKEKYVLHNDLNNVEFLALYKPTQKNLPAENFFLKQGFVMTEKKEHEGTSYLLKKHKTDLIECDWIHVMTKDEYDGR